jgi:2-succinyl-5-enolpyruvyl-6-hydroxy-3-cyclohexene-1-carboxylate synthase
MITTNKVQIAQLVSYCVQNNITNVVISPGSRNAPLIIAFEAHAGINTFLIHDERSAAFFALGMAENTGKPVVLTCTSGSALLNYAPAISEAYYRQIPLLVLSADRPTELIDQGDGQTIRQENVYKNFIKKSLNFPNHTEQDIQKKSLSICEDALSELMNVPYGPVHINIPLAEPLYETVDVESPEYQKIKLINKENLSLHQSQIITDVWSKSKKKLILIGQNGVNSHEAGLIKELAKDCSIAVLTENTSNIQDFKNICHCIDRTLSAIGKNEVDDYAPDLLISLGGAIISKRIKAFFRENKPKNNWRLGQFLVQEDTYQSLTESFQMDSSVVLKEIMNINNASQNNFGSKWKQKDFEARVLHDEFIANTKFSDLAAFNIVLDSIPENSNLHMGNSSVVRYCQLFDPIPSIHYFSNRGVSGIDGSTSTAAGFSINNKDKLNTIISGDISFFYDSNAFWNQYLGANLKVIVIRNGGGGIFQFIDGPSKSDAKETFFAPFSLNLESFCKTYNLKYFKADSIDSLSDSFGKFYQIDSHNRPSVLEVVTENEDNATILKEYFRHIGKLKE